MLNTIERKINEIKPYKGNAKKHSETQIKNVAESIRQFGFRQPIVLDKNNVIIIGHCRYEAAKLLNLETVPCNIAADLSSDQVKKLRNLDNKLNESEWDFDLLRNDISDLDFSDFDIDWEIPENEADEYEEKKREFRQRMEAGELSEHSEEYQEFLNMTQSTSLYNTGVEVTTADTIVTLSTCTSASDNHRFVVRGVKEEETKQ